MSNQNFIETIIEDWGSLPQADICLAILKYLYNRSKFGNPPSHITHGFLRRVVGGNYSEVDFLLAIQYLCGTRIKLLNPKFELIEGEDFF